MSLITLKIDKGESKEFFLLMNLAQCFADVRECKNHYSIRITEEEAFRFSDKLKKIIALIPSLREAEEYNIPDYGTAEWADFMIDLYSKKRQKTRRSNR